MKTVKFFLKIIQILNSVKNFKGLDERSKISLKKFKENKFDILNENKFILNNLKINKNYKLPEKQQKYEIFSFYSTFIDNCEPQ